MRAQCRAIQKCAYNNVGQFVGHEPTSKQDSFPFLFGSPRILVKNVGVNADFGKTDDLRGRTWWQVIYCMRESCENGAGLAISRLHIGEHPVRLAKIG